MKVSDYIVDFLIAQGIKHAYGYPGGMVTHLMDSLGMKTESITTHVTATEQGAAFAACGYAQLSQGCGFVYSTSGPGVTNLVTGIAHAYFDSIPLLVVTGQVNTGEQRGNTRVRQKGFQEMEVCRVLEPITKYCTMVQQADDIVSELDKAYRYAMEGRPSPVVLDIPMDVSRAIIEAEHPQRIELCYEKGSLQHTAVLDELREILSEAKRPLLLAGAGINTAGARSDFRALVDKLDIPVVTSMIAVDLLPSHHPRNLGFIGAYGHRAANIAVHSCDLLISIGSRLDIRQTGNDASQFAPNARIVRVDIDADEMTNHIHPDETGICTDLRALLPALVKVVEPQEEWRPWLMRCEQIVDCLYGTDSQEPANLFIQRLSALCDISVITTDVGQNQVWSAQSFIIDGDQRVLFSGGHGAMGCSLPLAIGASHASGTSILSISGDGGFQMNLQELAVIANEGLPIKLLVFDNQALGMIRQFQEMFFEKRYTQTTADSGFQTVDCAAIGCAYGLDTLSTSISDPDWDAIERALSSPWAALITVLSEEETRISPKLVYGNPPYDQDPPLDRGLLNDLLNLN